jgi:DNA-directed RNA polymerase specialized sigma24 family protein
MKRVVLPGAKISVNSSNHSTFFEHLYLDLKADPSDPLHRLKYERAWSEFWGHYAPEIRGWLRQQGVRESEIEEVLSRVMARLVEYMPTFEFDSKKGFSGWLWTVSKTMALKFWSSQDRHPGAVGTGDSDAAAQLAQVTVNEEAAVSFSRLLDTAMGQFLDRIRIDAEAIVEREVDPITWQAYVLLEKEKRKGQEVAKILKITYTLAMVKRGRVKKKIEEEMIILGRMRRTQL